MKARMSEQSTEFDPTVWVDAHGDYLFTFAVARVRDAATAEDLVQDTLLAAIQAVGSFDGRSSERTWLCGIMKHKIIDHFRKSSREVELNDEESDLSAYEQMFRQEGAAKGHWTAVARPAKWDDSPERVLEHAEFREALTNCLGRLPERVANVFTLRELDGFESEEICESLNISPGNLWVMMHRARLHLRRCIDLNWFKKVGN